MMTDSDSQGLPLIPGRAVARLLNINSTQLLRVAQLVEPAVPARGSGTDSQWSLANILCAAVVCELRSLGFGRSSGYQPTGSPFDFWVDQLPKVVTDEVAQYVTAGWIPPTGQLVFTRTNVQIVQLDFPARYPVMALSLPFPGSVRDIDQKWAEYIHANGLVGTAATDG